MNPNVLLPNQNFSGSNNLNQMMGMSNMGMPNPPNKKPTSSIQEPSQTFPQEKVNFFLLMKILINFFLSKLFQQFLNQQNQSNPLGNNNTAFSFNSNDFNNNDQSHLMKMMLLKNQPMNNQNVAQNANQNQNQSQSSNNQNFPTNLMMNNNNEKRKNSYNHGQNNFQGQLFNQSSNQSQTQTQSPSQHNNFFNFNNNFPQNLLKTMMNNKGIMPNNNENKIK